MAAPHPAPAGTPEALDPLLARYVVAHPDGVARVRYAAWQAAPADRAALDHWIAAAAQARPSAMARAEAFAFWANLYNALTLQVVLARYPVASIREIRSSGVPFDPKGYFGPWRTRLVTVEGRRLSLDDIEHGTMRPGFGDPRVHYTLNCASIGCPNLRPRAWRAATLEAELDAAAAEYVNHPRGVAVLADGRLHVSSIYRKYRADFGPGEQGVLDHLRRHAGPALAATLAGATPAAALAGPVGIAGDGYDWALNDAPG
jgi:hypothetical protein